MADTKLAEQILNKIGTQIVSTAKKNIAAENKRNTGNLWNSIKYRIESGANGVYVLIITLADYGIYVVGGRGPNKRMPPVEVIMRWLQTKKIPIGEGRYRNARGTTKFNDIAKLREMAFQLARKIGRFGIRPYNFFAPILDYQAPLNFVLNIKQFPELEKALATDIGNKITNK